MTSVLGTVSGLVRLPLRVVGLGLGVVKAVIPGGRRGQPPAPSSTSFRGGPVAEPDAGPRTPQGDPLRGPTTTSATATDESAEPAAAAAPAPAVGADPGEPLASVTEIDADAGPDDVDVTPSDVADAMGSQLDDRPPSPS